MIFIVHPRRIIFKTSINYDIHLSIIYYFVFTFVILLFVNKLGKTNVFIGIHIMNIKLKNIQTRIFSITFHPFISISIIIYNNMNKKSGYIV